jgi:hypothetical protein
MRKIMILTTLVMALAVPAIAQVCTCERTLSGAMRCVCK